MKYFCHSNNHHVFNKIISNPVDIFFPFLNCSSSKSFLASYLKVKLVQLLHWYWSLKVRSDDVYKQDPDCHLSTHLHTQGPVSQCFKFFWTEFHRYLLWTENPIRHCCVNWTESSPPTSIFLFWEVTLVLYPVRINILRGQSKLFLTFLGDQPSPTRAKFKFAMILAMQREKRWSEKQEKESDVHIPLNVLK